MIEAIRYIGTLAIWSVLVIRALDNLGFEITALVAGLGIGGVAVGLAAQSILGDLFASLAIVVDRLFAIGDFWRTGHVGEHRANRRQDDASAQHQRRATRVQ